MTPDPRFDIEARTLADMLSLGKWDAHEAPRIERQLRDRLAMIEAGLLNPTSLHWTARLQELDARLRLRWDFQQGWVIERAAPEWRCHVICGVLGFNQVPVNLMDILRAGDMQRYAPGEYLRRKRAEAEERRAANDARSTDKVMAAVDRMSAKAVQEFIQVERAIHTGDTIVAHGATETMLAKMTRASEQAGQTPAAEPVKMEGRYGKHI